MTSAGRKAQKKRRNEQNYSSWRRRRGHIARGLASLAAQTVSVELVRTFDYTVASGYALEGTGQINDHGVFVLQGRHDLTLAGALGFANGDFSQPFFGPNDSDFTFPFGINNRGVVCGAYDDSGTQGLFGFKSNIKTYDPHLSKIVATTVASLNAGNFVGLALTGRVPSAYAVIDGVLIRILTTSQARASGINRLNEVVGSYAVDTGGAGAEYHGFLRAPDGTLTRPIDFPGALQTTPKAINDSLSYPIPSFPTVFPVPPSPSSLASITPARLSATMRTRSLFPTASSPS